MTGPKKLVADWMKQAWEAVKPDVEAFVDRQFEKWMPKLITAVVTAMAAIGAKIANSALKATADGIENVEDVVTDFVPTKIDDQLADAFLGPILDRLRNMNL